MKADFEFDLGYSITEYRNLGAHSAYCWC